MWDFLAEIHLKYKIGDGMRINLEHVKDVGSCSICDPLMDVREREFFEHTPGKHTWNVFSHDFGWIKSSTWHFWNDVYHHTRAQLNSVRTGLCAAKNECKDRMFQFVPQWASVQNKEDRGGLCGDESPMRMVEYGTDGDEKEKTNKDSSDPFSDAGSMWLTRPWELPYDSFGGMAKGNRALDGPWHALSSGHVMTQHRRPVARSKWPCYDPAPQARGTL